MKEMLAKVVARNNLRAGEAKAAMETIMEGKATPAQAGAFLTALKLKGETPEEIAAFAGVMREKAVRIFPSRQPLVDTCGTGGDGSGTFNISTAAAIVAAASGVAVAKHGNRAMSGKSGSADVIVELGGKLLPPDDVRRSIEEIGFGFMFAQEFHPAMRNVGPVRKELGFRTVFNMLGPLTNPAGARAQVLGVFDPGIIDLMAGALMELGTKKALVVHSEGMDEVGLGPTLAGELRDGRLERRVIDPSEFGITRAEIPKASSAGQSAAIITGALQGIEGPAMDICILNAAAAIYVADAAESIREGLEIARKAVASGAAIAKLEELRRFHSGA